MKKNIKRMLIVFIFAVMVVGVSFLPCLNATYVSKSLEHDEKPSSTIFSTDNIRISVQEDNDLIIIQYQLNEFSTDEITINGVEYKQIKLDDESNIMIKGKPNLPTICRSIIIPDDQKMKIKVTYSQFEEYNGIKIVPSKGNLMRTQNPDDTPYVFDGIYNEDIWFPKQVAELEDPYILRDFRGQVVKINPFQYNPSEEKLRFYTDITVEIYPTGIDTVNCITRSDLPSKIDTDFKPIYKNHFINFETTSYTPVEEQGNMLVITYDSFWDAMMPFVQWKNMKGIPTEMVKVSDIGNANEIKSYISDYYNDNGLTFVLLVGDAQQVPSLYASGGASDPSYSYIVGSDHYPDLFVGRFSAQDVDQVETQVERSVEYEKDPQESADWYHKGIGIASNQGPGDDGEYDDEHVDYIRDDLLGYTYTLVDQIYDPYGTASQVANALNDGRSVINYCGHGWSGGWGSTGFGSSEVNALTNDNMLPFIWTVACNNGEFDNYNACFAEAWLRATHNNEPTGAIAVFGSSIGQSWDPPMDAQDEFNDLLVGEQKNTFGGLSYNGCMHMNDEYGSYGWEMTDTWILFGDPSIQVRTDTPGAMTVTHLPSIPIGALTFEVDVEGIEGALCAVSRDYDLFGYGYTDASGHVIIEFSDPIPAGNDMDLVVTAYNMMPYFDFVAVSGEDDPPETPETPDGPGQGAPGDELSFSSSTIDPDDDQIYYLWDWGDGNFSEWIGPYNSGEICTELYTWNEKGTYSIRVKAKDVYEMESDWSDPLEVIMPRGKTVVFILNLLEQIFPRIYSQIINLVYS